MPVRVVDASAAGALIFGEPQADEVATALGDAPLAAPALLWFELASVCLKKVKAHPDQTNEILTAFRLARELAITTMAVDHESVVRLAIEAQLTTYDASYLWLARELAGELVTLDAALRQAAHAVGQ